jgi:hypothetical protein
MRRVLSALPLACATALAALSIGFVAAPLASAAPPDDPAPSCPIDPETGECLPDRDRDGRGDTVDNCPDHFNPGQEDNDGDSVGNTCDPTPNGGDPPPPPGDPPPSTPGTNCDGGEGVYVYQHVDYQGGCYKLTGDSGHAYYWSTVGNDAASSLRIVGGWSVVLYTEGWYSGGSVALTTSQPNPWAWGGSWSWNDTISSARVYRDADHDGHADGADNCPTYYSPDNRCDADPFDSVEEDEEGSAAASAEASSQGGESVTSGCHWRRIGRKHHNRLGYALIRYNLRVDWCWNATVITSVNVRVWPEILANCCWRFARHLAYDVYDTAQDATYYAHWGRAYFKIFVQGEFELCLPYIDCPKAVYPWIELTANRGGTSTKSSGGTR